MTCIESKTMITLDTIYNMDCLEGMKQIPDGTIDAVICDLPYGTMKGMGVGTQYEGKTEWDDIIPTDKLFAEYERVLRRGGVARVPARVGTGVSVAR